MSRRTLLVGCLLASSLWPLNRARAEELSPAIYLLIDTSGSMIWDPAQSFYYGCQGDGSTEHPEVAGCTSRLHMAKDAVSIVVNGYPEVRWGLSRFAQNEGPFYTCMCGTVPGGQSVNGPGEPNGYCDFYYRLALDLANVYDRICVNYGGAWSGGWCASGCCDWFNGGQDLAHADILVALAENNESQILMWVDHHEDDFQAGREPNTGNHCWNAAAQSYGDCELRAMGGTPIAGSLQSLYGQLSNTDLGIDPRRGCRPYRIILLTDGQETCGGDPVARATDLRSTPDLQHTCTTNADCPLNSWCSGGRCRYDVKTHVIAFATTDTAFDQAAQIAAAGGTGTAVQAWNTDEIVAAMADIIADSLVSELCNNVDDDCDGLTDEDFPLGQVCNNGLLGICYAEGQYVCDPNDPTSVICQVDPNTPQPGANQEVCNGLDDDCDGQIDEGGVCTCQGPELCNGLDDYCDNWATHAEGSEDPNVGQPCGTDVGACTTGTTYCWQDPANPSNVEIRCSGQGPVPEVCDANLPENDQNCNGTNNDGIPPQPCQKTNAYGTCDGQQTCDVDGNWTCWAKDPAPESCNNVDDDCDGLTDEGLTRSCSNTNAYGTCIGTETCVTGIWGGCTAATPAAEVCNNVDDDCDGATDEGLTRSCSNTNAYGTCTGTETCTAGIWGGCTAATPAAESCNNVDDDCDGQTDEGLTQSCYTGPAGTEGVGECRGGTQTCSAGSWGGCVGQVLPSVEVCDGKDNDCDGQTDEDLGQTTCGLGECAHTIQNCVNGVPQTCDPYAGATAEVCDGKDNDCDGQTDEGLTRSCYTGPAGTDGVGLCHGGTQTCTNGSWGACAGEVTPQPEVCDNQDNDCDGSTDEGLVEACYPPGYGASTGCTAPGSCVGACQEGSRTCSAGSWSACTGAVTPQLEVCDNQDNDCDGQTDEGLTRSCSVSNGFGTCTGTETCTAGSWGGCTAATPAAEVCNNVDDDCDGATDEGLTRSCSNTNAYGTCTGTETCTAGIWGGCTAATPAAESCNNVDDDCDGQTDEGLTQSCYTGPAGTEGVGECRGGTQTCSAGSWGGCVGQVLPSVEVCDGKDNDCDGQTDEDLGQTTCGLGECAHTIQNCVNGVPQTCDPYAGATAEVCDGKDNDCDGQTDEGLTRSCYTGPAGTDGVGLCHGGTQTCTNGSWGACAGEVTPQPEACDNQDNDCDGLTDEGLVEACYPPGYGASTGCTAPGSCVGACQEGSRTCSAGSWSACTGAVTPQLEVCDNQDNDCDGQTDEGLTRSCSVSNGFGTCTGTETCTAGSWGGCTAATPAAESCNNVDDDCDGQTDEDLTRSCYTGPAGTEGVGACRAGLEVCTAGAWGSCQGDVTPRPEVCNDVDDDCDGQTDEDLTETCYTGPAGTEGVGECHAGTRSCMHGSWGVCTGQVVPVTEVCDGKDNDCDGQTDEDLGETTCGQGECRHTVQNCVNGVPQVCDPLQGASQEVCDGLDNDCDGITDGLQRACYPFAAGCMETQPGSWTCTGQCQVGVQECRPDSGGQWSACQFAVGPQSEDCNGLDDDCDGQTDEDDQGNPLSGACYPPGSGPDTGCTYDATSQTWNCLGECRAGTRLCSNAQWGTCQGAVTPDVERCDGLDNDCDGETDEEEDIPGLNQPCGTALGRCTPGVLRCINGQEVCEGGEGPYPGECNGLDDDCDGAIDEADEVEDQEGLPCGQEEGVCEPGTTKCLGGQIVCEGGVLPSEEVCNGLDDDCDGLTDDQAECPPDYYCIEGDCRPVCDPSDEFSCPGDLKCQEADVAGEMVYVCLPEHGECGGQTCPEGWVCENGECVDPCDPNPCEWWQECRAGQCIDVSCTAPGNECPPGQFCLQHECVEDPCTDSPCGEGEYCVTECSEEACTADCRPLCTCSPEERCTLDGRCEPNRCAYVDCAFGERCDPETGTCEPDPCTDVTCPSGEVCHEGDCIEDPCSSVHCPAGYLCEIRGDPSDPVELCVPNSRYWVPGEAGKDILGTGTGGCACRSSGPPDAALWLWLWLLGLVWLRRRMGR